MSEESNERRRSGSYFRTIMDIGMGIFYVFIGSLIIYGRGFNKITMPDFIMQIPVFVIYILGAMMIIGGCFRFYRGLSAVMMEKKYKDMDGR